MAKRLVDLRSLASDRESYYELSPDKNTLDQLTENFQGSFTPILLVGDIEIGLEDSLLAEFFNTSEENCLLVWPQPVIVQGRSLLLMKMWNVDTQEKDESKVEAVRRLLSVFFSLSGHCVDSLELIQTFHDLCFLQDVYEELHRGGMHRMHFVVLEQGRANKQSYDKAVKNKSSVAQFTDFLLKAEWKDPNVFFSRVLDFVGAPDFEGIENWCRALHFALRFANIDSDRSEFFVNFPNFEAGQDPQRVAMLTCDEQQQERLRRASALEFVARGNSPCCKLDRPVVDTLLTNFDEKKPTVVLTVIGESGVGKSTFLNHLTRHAFRRRSLVPHFAMGSLQQRCPTKNSCVLSCPLPLTGSGSQVMLVDLEGASSAELLNEDDMQLNLVSGVLTFTSIPCFIVKSYQQEWIEKYIRRFVFLSKTFGYQCKRIYLLLSDEDLEFELPANVQKRVDLLNEKFFDGEPVIHPMNKPSFNNPDKGEMCREFLTAFLADCDYPKRNISGQALPIKDICDRLESITQSFNAEQIVIDFLSIDAEKKAILQRSKAKSELLLYYEENRDFMDKYKDEAGQSQTFYSVHTNLDAMQALSNNFSTCKSIMPVLSVGSSSCGRSAVLDSILLRELRQFCDVDEGVMNFSNFASDERQPGVYVWPYPVRFGDVTLLLLKMWGVNFEDPNEELRALNDQVLYALLCLTSVCIVNTTKNGILPMLKNVHQLYREMHSAKELAVSKFIAFAEEEKRTNIESEEALDRLREDGLLEITKFLFRGGEKEGRWVNELCDLLANPESHIPYSETHQGVLTTELNPMNRVNLMLSLFMKVVNLDLDYESFKGAIPRFSSGEFEQHEKSVGDRERFIGRVRSGVPLKFYLMHGGAYELNSSVIETLQQNYDLQKPTIVMAIIGSPGLGKSTLLNHLIRKSIGGRRYLEMFKTGNSATQTTKESQVFSQPLQAGGLQLMLIDLEGLGGTETTDARLNLLQVNLVSAILTVASVPCIIVRNEANTFNSVEKVISKVSQLKDNFGFKIERMQLLFQDRDEQVSMGNPEFTMFINDINRRYFEGRAVLKLKNKPNFTSSGKTKMRDNFLKDLLADSIFPKRNHSGANMNIFKILVELQYITVHHNYNLEEIAISKEEMILRDVIEAKKLEQLNKIEENVVCTSEDKSLVIIFNERYQVFIHQKNPELDLQSENVKEHVRIALESQAGMYRMKLAKIEYCYRAMRSLPARMEQHLEYLCNKYWWADFLDHTQKIQFKLHQISLRYPQYPNILEGVVQEFVEKKKTQRNSRIYNYGIQIATVGISSERTATWLAAGIIGTAAFLSTFGDTSTTPFKIGLHDTAFALLNSKNQLSEDAETLLNKVEENKINCFVIMVIGTKRIKSSFLLNEFLSNMSPFSLSDAQIFEDSEQAQMFHFYYQCPYRRATDADTCGLIIYLCMKNNSSNLTEHLAAKLISRVSLTCMFFDLPDKYAQPIIYKAFLQSEESVRNYTSSFRPKIAAFYRANCDCTGFCEKLATINVPSITVPIKEFNEQGRMATLVTVHSEFDRSAALSPSDLRAAFVDATSGIHTS